MSDEKYTIEQVAVVVDGEGLGYAVQHYMGADSIEDGDLARLWRIAKEALEGIDEILEAETGTETDDEGPEDGL